MVNLVVRHSSLHMQQAGTSTKPNNTTSNTRATKVAPGGGYDRTVPSPIRIPSIENSRAVSPLTTSESLFGGGAVPVEAVGGARGASPRRHHLQDDHHLMMLEDRYAPSSIRRGDSDPVGQQHPNPLIVQHLSGYSSPSTPSSHITRGRERDVDRGRDPSPHIVRIDGTSSGNTNHGADMMALVGAGEPECDYDISCTSLYELLESSEWEAARIRCRTHPKEVRTWIVRRDGKSNKIRWKLLPLHAAVIFQAPTVVVSSLLDQFPLAAAKRDDQGMLPLHLAFRHHQPQDEAVLQVLLEQYPKGVLTKDRRDRYPLDHGKETQFSAHLMALYANAHSRCASNSNANNDSNNENKNLHNTELANNAIALAKAASEAAEREKLSAQYASQLQTLKSMYEERIDNLAEQHRAKMEDLRRQFEEEERVNLERHTQELDELRDLLSSEVTSGQRVSELELQIDELKESLVHSSHETDLLQTVLRDQKQYEDDLKDQVRKVLVEQQTLYSLCTQQQEQLEQAQDMRDQLLRSLLQKDTESHKSCRVVNLEISRIAENIRRRSETILSSSVGRGVGAGVVSGGRGAVGTTSATYEDDDVDAGIGHENGVDALANIDLHRLDMGSGAKGGDGVLGDVARRGLVSSDGSNGNHHHHDDAHDDDISAITENSHF
jgi:hypothetical protein